jgi:hypothetical protein
MKLIVGDKYTLNEWVADHRSFIRKQRNHNILEMMDGDVQLLFNPEWNIDMIRGYNFTSIYLLNDVDAVCVRDVLYHPGIHVTRRYSPSFQRSQLLAGKSNDVIGVDYNSQVETMQKNSRLYEPPKAEYEEPKEDLYDWDTGKIRE